MIPTEQRLIEGIRAAVAPLKSASRSAEDQRRAAAIDVALDELLLRQDRAFVRRLIDDGLGLVADAAELGVAAAPDAESIGAIEQISGQLTSVISALSGTGGKGQEPARLMGRIVDWENMLHKRRLEATAPRVSDRTVATITAEALQDYLAGHLFKGAALAVSSLQQLPGGFSKLTVIFDVQYQDREASYVLRGEQPLNLLFLEGTDICNEYHVLRFARRMGLPVAEPLWLEPDASKLGARFLISEKARGRNFGSRVDVREVISPALLRDLMQRLVAIHTAQVDPSDEDIAQSHLAAWARYQSLTDCVAAQIEFWRNRSSNFGLQPSPILERALHWLSANVPVNGNRPALLHGDFGLHNVLIDDAGRVSCILDWEAAGLGDPADDMAWLCAGLRASYSQDDIVSLYHELGGPHLSEERLRYFQVMNAVRFEVTCARALHLFQCNDNVGIDALQLGLLYMYHGTGTLNQDIERAEAASRPRPGL